MAASIAEGTIYRYFPSKEQLALDLFLGHHRALAEALTAAHKPLKGLKAKIEAIVRCYCDWADRDWTLFAYHLLNQHSFLIQVPDGTPNPVNVVREVIAPGDEGGRDPAPQCRPRRRRRDRRRDAAGRPTRSMAASPAPLGPCPLLRRCRLGGAVGQGEVDFVRYCRRGLRRGLRAAVPDGSLCRAPAHAGLVTAPSRDLRSSPMSSGSRSATAISARRSIRCAFLRARLARVQGFRTRWPS